MDRSQKRTAISNPLAKLRIRSERPDTFAVGIIVRSAKGADARRDTGKQRRRSWLGTLDPASVLRSCLEMLELTWKKAAAWRAWRHHLVARAPAGNMLAVASRLCGLHAQLMSSAELSASLRVENLKREAIQQALWKDRTLVKTWAMRGTLHLLPADELPLWHGALSVSRRYLRPTAWKKYFGITLEQLDQLTQAVAAALDGRVMTREELVKEVHRLSGSAAFAAKLAQSSWGTILKPAAFTGRLCFGPSVGQRVCFTSPDTWLASTGRSIGARVEPETAQAAIARRFLAAYGPATYHDLARWWNGGGVAVAKQWISRLRDEVSPVEVEGTPAWMLADDAREMRKFTVTRSVRLLPAFDQYVVGASYHAKHLLPGDLRARVYRQQGWISPVLLVNGFMQGVWRHEIKASRVEVTIEPFIKTPAWVRRAADQEAERLAEFLGCTLTVSWRG